MDPAIVTRFAPSPTGALHPGNARTALFNWLLARAGKGRFLLRIEDSDRARGGADFESSQLADLRWLGMDWDAGPDRPDARGPYRQSERSAFYGERLALLEREGRAYPCFCTPAELEAARRAQAAAGLPPRYPGTCRGLGDAQRRMKRADGVPAPLRFAIPAGRTVAFDDLVRGPQSVDTAALGDFLLSREGGAPVFLFCNAVDDASMGVTHVLRGEDHLSNTPRQLLLAEALGLASPRYGHLPLLLDAGGTPQSKRRGSVTMGELRARGILPAALLNYLLRLGHHGAPDGWVDPAAMPAHFDATRLGRAPAHYDEVQLDHWQREAVRRLSPPQAAEWLGGVLPADWSREDRVAAAALLQGNLLRPEDARPWVAVLSGELGPLERHDREVVAQAGAAFFESALEAYEQAGADLARLARRLKERTGRQGADLYRPLRIALTGRHDGPELAALLSAIPQPLVRARLAQAARLR